ncbi:MAG TPA: hypothetical protein VJ044_16225, partial [Candidatus Hodarchaeales archaeon]|nr:hypothetical protein [Candidatus Hodarchaeales archaeon]
LGGNTRLWARFIRQKRLDPNHSIAGISVFYGLKSGRLTKDSLAESTKPLMSHAWTVHPEISYLEKDRYFFANESLNPILQLAGTDFKGLGLLLPLSRLNSRPEIDGQHQENYDHFQGNQQFLSVHD